MKKIGVLFFGLLMCFLLVGCGCQIGLEKFTTPKLILLHTASKEHHDRSSIFVGDGGRVLSVSTEDVESWAKEHEDWKNVPIVVYCENYACAGSTEGAKVLREKGFSNVRAFEGGLAKWVESGYKIKGDAEGVVSFGVAPEKIEISVEALKKEIDEANR